MEAFVALGGVLDGDADGVDVVDWPPLGGVVMKISALVCVCGGDFCIVKIY